MADPKTLPSTTEPITTEQLLTPGKIGPMTEIDKSVPIQEMGIDIATSITQEVLSSNIVELQVGAPAKKQIERALGRIIYGRAFRYRLDKLEGNAFYDLKVLWLGGTITLVQFATLLQGQDYELMLLSNGVLITLDEASIAIPPEF